MGSRRHMPMQPVWETVTWLKCLRPISSTKAIMTGLAPAAMPQVAMPTTMRTSLSLSSRRRLMRSSVRLRISSSSAMDFIVLLQIKRPSARAGTA